MRCTPVNRSIRALIVAITALVSIASWPANAASDEYAEIHSVAIYSAVGDSLRVATQGVTAFGNGLQEVPIKDWGIDDWIVSTITQNLSGRFQIKTVPIDRQIFVNCDVYDGCASKLPRTDTVDAYVIVTRYWSQGLGGQNLQGIGIYFNSVPFSDYMCTVHAIYIVQIISAKTGKIIDFGRSILNGKFGEYPPIQKMDGSDWKNKWDALSDDQKAQFKGIVLKLVQDSLPNALEKANLPNEAILPLPGAMRN